MEIDAMLADYAMVSEGKLFLTGAGITDIVTAPQAPFVISVHVGVVVRVPYTATNQQHEIRVRLLDADERPVKPFVPGQDPDSLLPLELATQITVGRPPQLVVGDEQSVALAFGVGNAPLEQDGGYHFSVEVDGTEMTRLPLRVHKAAQPSLISRFPV